MKSVVMYWIVVAILGIIHLYQLALILPWKIPIYLSSLLAMGIAYYFYKSCIIHLSDLGMKSNGLLFVLQLVLLVVSTSSETVWLNLAGILIFAGIEIIRFCVSKKLFLFHQENRLLKEQAVHFNETFRIVRSERHDFLKHVSAIHFMLENGTYAEAKTYLDELVDGYEETNLSIKGERGIVASVLHQMYRKSKTAGITMVYDFDLPLSTLPLSDTDMVKLLGNLLGNSIEASEEWKREHKQEAVITLEFYKRSGLYVLNCKNNCPSIPTPILDGLFRDYGKTTKANGHEGLGTKIIQDLVNSYQGFLDFVHKDETFTVKMKFPAIQ